MRIIVLLGILFLLPPPLMALDEPFGGLKLLDGFSFERSHSIDTINGVISKANGLRIEFESGISEGYAVEPKNKQKYVWYREQVVNGNRVLLALTQAKATAWRPAKNRSQKVDQILMVTFPGKFGSMDAANFYAEVLDEKEVAEMLLMVLTFDPNK